MNANLLRGMPYRWKPGESGNPGGRPKKRPLSNRYAELAEVLMPEKERIKYGLPRGATYGDAIALRVFNGALNGKVDAIREIREAIEGKAAQRNEAAEPENREITIRVVYDTEFPTKE